MIQFKIISGDFYNAWDILIINVVDREGTKLEALALTNFAKPSRLEDLLRSFSILEFCSFAEADRGWREHKWRQTRTDWLNPVDDYSCARKGNQDFSPLENKI